MTEQPIDIQPLIQKLDALKNTLSDTLKGNNTAKDLLDTIKRIREFLEQILGSNGIALGIKDPDSNMNASIPNIISQAQVAKTNNGYGLQSKSAWAQEITSFINKIKPTSTEDELKQINQQGRNFLSILANYQNIP